MTASLARPWFVGGQPDASVLLPGFACSKDNAESWPEKDHCGQNIYGPPFVPARRPRSGMAAAPADPDFHFFPLTATLKGVVLDIFILLPSHIDCDPSRIPTGFRPKAQGCDASTAMELGRKLPPTPRELRPVRLWKPPNVRVASLFAPPSRNHAVETQVFAWSFWVRTTS